VVATSANLVQASSGTSVLRRLRIVGGLCNLRRVGPLKATDRGGHQVQTRTAVRASRATLLTLKVVPPNRAYLLTLRVRDAAAYLRYRVHRVVTVMNRLTPAQWLFRSRTLVIRNASGRRVLLV
jgi:hypothetical protein